MSSLWATRYDILRQIPADGQVTHHLPEKPTRVATLIREAEFAEFGEMQHLRTVFLEDHIHDWNWTPNDKKEPNGPGQFTYYTRVSQCADVVIAYEITREPPTALLEKMRAMDAAREAQEAKNTSYHDMEP